MRTATIRICRSNLDHNAVLLKSKTKAKLLAMVKADAYGHGIEAVVPALTAADGFGVACMSEALQVKSCLKDNRPIVLIEGAFGADEWQQAIAYNLQCVIHHQAQLEYALALIPPFDCATRTVWLKVNTGMNRLGFDPTNAKQAAQTLMGAGYRVILTSHFACADTPHHPMNHAQIARFEALLGTLKNNHPNLQASMCNSSALFALPQCHHDWVRAGIALYGASPLDRCAKTLGLRPVMRLSAQVMAIHSLKAGETVGYGASWQAQQDTTLGIVSIGYGDGYPRHIQNAKVWLNNAPVPIVGRVAMDMTAIDLAHTPAKIGDEVEFWGERVAIDKVARWAGTISYELFCRLTSRPLRVLI